MRQPTGVSNFPTRMLRLCLLLALSCSVGHQVEGGSVWTWECKAGTCKKHLLEADETPLGLEACKLTCDTYSILWPRPTGQVDLGKVLVPLDYNSLSIIASTDGGRELSQDVEQLVNEAGDIFRQQVTSRMNKDDTRSDSMSLEVNIVIHDDAARNLKIGSDESYALRVYQSPDNNMHADIISPAFFGARHGLETLNQLIVYDDVSGGLVMVRDVNMTDSPAFPYRSLSLDTARNYFTVAAIKRTIDGMAASKLNNFHWHITDSHSFPFQSKSYPLLTEYGAYRPHEIYTADDVQAVVDYARARGVRVVPEFDAPAHVGEGWQWAGPNVTVCVNSQPWSNFCVEPPCGQLNPTNDTVYEILGGIYRDMLELFSTDIFHMGGDEVNFGCWRSVQEITDWMKSKGYGDTDEDFVKLWSMFQDKAYAKLVEANGGTELPVILWTSHLTEAGHVDKYLDNKKYIIQIWTTGQDKVIAELVNKGFRVIFSNYDALYFDCGFGGWVSDGNNWCSPYIGWQKVYENNPYTLLANQGVDVGPGTTARELVLGAEAALWTEQVDDSSLDGRFWPRASAMAERLWANPQETWRQAETRMLAHRERLVQRGLHAEALEPQWCYQNEGDCPQN